jgi:ankyrin repeat protein
MASNSIDIFWMSRKRGLISLCRSAAAFLLLFAGAALAADPQADAATRDLLRAVDAGSVAQVEAALGRGARIDESGIAWTGQDGQPALVAAALRGHARIVSLLLERGADPLVTEKDGFNVWHAAAFQGRPAVLQVLIDARVAGYGISERDGFTPLHRASWGRTQRHFSAVQLLVTSGGRACDEPDREGRRASELAKRPQVAAWLKACSPGGSASAGPSTSAQSVREEGAR